MANYIGIMPLDIRKELVTILCSTSLTLKNAVKLLELNAPLKLRLPERFWRNMLLKDFHSGVSGNAELKTEPLPNKPISSEELIKTPERDYYTQNSQTGILRKYLGALTKYDNESFTTEEHYLLYKYLKEHYIGYTTCLRGSRCWARGPNAEDRRRARYAWSDQIELIPDIFQEVIMYHIPTDSSDTLYIFNIFLKRKSYLMRYLNTLPLTEDTLSFMKTHFPQYLPILLLLAPTYFKECLCFFSAYPDIKTFYAKYENYINMPFEQYVTLRDKIHLRNKRLYILAKLYEYHDHNSKMAMLAKLYEVYQNYQMNNLK
jgi:hypothetical protein